MNNINTNKISISIKKSISNWIIIHIEISENDIINNREKKMLELTIYSFFFLE